MKIENKLPYFPLYARDMLWVMSAMSASARGAFFTLLCETWSRNCEWITIDEAQKLMAGFKVTPKQFQKIRKELQRYVANGVFKFTSLEEDKENAIEISNKNKANANKRWEKQRKLEMRSQCYTDTNTNTDTHSNTKPEINL